MAIDQKIPIRHNRNNLELGAKSLTGKYVRGENIASMKTHGKVFPMKVRYCKPSPHKKFDYIRKHRPDLAELALATLDKIYRDARHNPTGGASPSASVAVLHREDKPPKFRSVS